MEELQKYQQQLGKQQSEFGELKHQFTGLSINGGPNAALADLQSENQKLKYRLEMLKRSIAQEEEAIERELKRRANKEKLVSYDPKYISNNVLRLQDSFNQIVSSLYPQLENFSSTVTRSTFADYQTNVALVLVKPLKHINVTVTPAQLFDKIVKQIPANGFYNVDENLNPKAPPFLNIHLQNSYVTESIKNLLTHGIHVRPIDNRSRVIVDYSSPNIAKEMHVGHLRSTIIGDCISNILEFVGYDVLRLNHVGDWGTQFGMLLAYLIEKYPDFQSNPPPIADLQEFYKESKKRFDNEPEFKLRAKNTVVSLQAHDPKLIEAWKLICAISRRENNFIYESLGIRNLQERGESFYHDLMKQVVDDLEKKKILIEDGGAKIAWPSDAIREKSYPLTVVKSDRGYTYDTSDLACIRHRVAEEKADRIIYVTDDGQSSHFDLIFRVARDAGFYDPEKVRVEHVGFGAVLGEDRKKFKTRSGEVVRLKDLLKEGLDRAKAKLIEKERDKVLTAEEFDHANKTVAYGCIKYADLCRDLKHDYEFSFNRMLDDKGNTAVYMLYSLARIRSIIRKASQHMDLESILNSVSHLKLEHARELRLAKFILRFAEVIQEVADTLYPHTLCTYLFELSVVFSEFYEVCYCIEKHAKNNGEDEEVKVNISRVLLCEATARILTQGLNLLGIQTLEKM